ncbi:glycoside hydrolase family 71/99-like protein [Hufsiella ginkgonis]|uniref:Xylosidase n=1 Tax=Hufsiella ginkgonis TaxID=2695274 RepID=A0A7K1Y335_9SPHI|nr:glycoside hydrolase family 71/99-like protein [Hufsiella ginkgonis]MXV17651.1 xylosidase [Hufsiella ginkgonis]
MSRPITKLFFLSFLFFAAPSFSQSKHARTSLYKSYKGLVMAGYQGWFNTPTDGANRGWTHFALGGKFEPGFTKVDMWPDVSEYAKTYQTPFLDKEGRQASVFSSHDRSTTDLHFKWMKDYGIDGVFMQRFVSNLKERKSRFHITRVLGNALDAAQTNKRAISVMYDFSGMREGDEEVVINDWKNLVDSLKLTGRPNQTYLYHNGKPLVALWGVGFNDGRRYTLVTIKKIIDFLQHDPVYGNCAILLGVPTHWRELNADAISDPELLEVCKHADIIHPWLVGRYNERSYPRFQAGIKADLEWCKLNKVDYVPVVFPGFSWHNMKPASPFNQTPRNRGNFFWQQVAGCISLGAEMIYVAMFDEIDEGTAIFKISKNPPAGASSFVTFEDDVPPDHYLFLAGYAARMLRKEVPFTATMPKK